MLTLSKEGLTFLKECRYIIAFLHSTSSLQGVRLDYASPQHSDCSRLFETSALCQLVHHLNDTVPVSEGMSDFVTFMDMQEVDDLEYDPSGDVSHRVQYVYAALQYLSSQYPQLPHVETDETEASTEELRMVVTAIGGSALGCKDINDDLLSEPTMFDTGAWAIYTNIMLGLIGVTLVSVNLPARVSELLGPANTMSALTNALAIFNIVQLFASPTWHRISDRIGRKPSMVIISLNYAVCLLGFAFSTSYKGILFFRAWSGLGAIYTPLGNTIVADITPVRQRSQALAYLNGSMWTGSFLGICLNILLHSISTWWQWKELMILGSLLSFSGGMVSLFFLRESAPIRIARTETKALNLSVKTAPKESGFKKTFTLITHNPNLLLIFVGFTLTLGAHSSFSATSGGIVYNNCDVDPDNFGTLYSFNRLMATSAGLLGSIVVGPISKRVGEKMTIYMGQALAIIPLSMCALDKDGMFNFYVYTFECFLNGVSDGLANPNFIALCSEWSSPEDRGMMLGLFQIGNSLGRSIFSLALGYLYDWNPHASWFIALSWPVIGVIVTALAKVPHERHMIEAEIRKRAAEQEADAAEDSKPLSEVPV
ncbi:major facilitator, sugar transporter-like [Kipferlia bialata]|uniref:Major facilitator, sugar transporter-like n=1 Tax=Kipferlia bialata TaxID=797122 RepID=A0A9K3GEY4_9EUKA|nr:major facilitator, sugar transporter-like [Kipferlia bialata]|eukprot:g1085.t1